MSRETNVRQTDIHDKASDVEASFREAAIREVQARLVESHPDFNGADCVDCSEEIPPLRLQMCRIRCVGCQTDLEYTRRTRG